MNSNDQFTILSTAAQCSTFPQCMCLCVWLLPLTSHSHTCHSLASAWPQASCKLRLG